jgi:hypothetical protein
MGEINSTASERLAVYGTNGEEFHPNPEEESGLPEASQWFLKSGLRCYFDAAEKSVMAYLGDVRHPHELDQAFAVYNATESGYALLENFIRSVQRELKENKGWELVKPTTTTDAKSLYHLLAKVIRAREDSSIQLSNHSAQDSELICDALKSNKTGTIQVLAGDYGVAVRLLKSYVQTDSIRTHIYDGRNSEPPSDVDLAISVEPGPYELKIPDEGETHLENLQQRRKRIQARNRTEDTVEALSAHAKAEDDFAIVRDAVEEGLHDNYGRYTVVEQNEYDRLEQEVSNLRRKLDQKDSTIASLQRKLDSEQERVSRLETDAALTRNVNRLKSVFSRPLNFFVEERTEETSEQNIYRNTDGGHQFSGHSNQGLSQQEKEPSKEIQWNRVIALLLLIVLIGVVSYIISDLGGGLPTIPESPFDLLSALASGIFVVTTTDIIPLHD